MKKILVILGQTATGKTDLALNLARQFDGEIVACDSRQVYSGLDIGTGKMPGESASVKKENGCWIVNGIKIWMYDVADPKEQYTVQRYIEDAQKVIEDIVARNKLPIIVGGTGLYLKGILEGIPNLQIPYDLKLRKKLQAYPKEKLQIELQKIAPDVWETLNNSEKNNPRRLIRHIEIALKGDSHLASSKSNDNILKIGLTASRDILNKRIDERLEKRIGQGLVEEGRKLIADGLSLERMRQLGLEYGVLADLLEGKITEDEFSFSLKQKIHQFAKRQMVWFKRDQDIIWFDITDNNLAHRVEEKVGNWYNEFN